jgi:predicted RNA-binding protein YlxR (DUF448 family)
MEQKKKIPLRQCVGCAERKPKSELLRVVRSPEGEISLDKTGRKNGRGVYICSSVKCFNKARKSGKLSSHLECSIPEEVLEALAAEIEQG